MDDPRYDHAHCQNCGTEIKRERRAFFDRCKKCETISRGIDWLMKENPHGAIDLLLSKLTRLTKGRLSKKRMQRTKSKDIEPLHFSDPISEAPATLHATVVSVSGRHRLDYHSVRGGKHIKVLEEVDFQRLERGKNDFLCQRYPDYDHIHEWDRQLEADCKKCLQRAESLEKRGIEIEYLTKSQAQDFRDKRWNEMRAQRNE